MQIHADRGEHTQALSLYESLRRRLSRDLGIRPEPATLAVYEAIRRRRAAAGSSGEERSEEGYGERSGDGPDVQPAALAEDRAGMPSMAVLRFRPSGDVPEQTYFAQGLH